jgi:hypothetical protein
MRRPSADRTAIAPPRAAFALAGLLSSASAALCALLASGHAASLGAICGAVAAPHCGWCLAATGFALAGLAAFHAASDPAA